jgi:hypothetical protein
MILIDFRLCHHAYPPPHGVPTTKTKTYNKINKKKKEREREREREMSLTPTNVMPLRFAIDWALQTRATRTKNHAKHKRARVPALAHNYCYIHK